MTKVSVVSLRSPQVKKKVDLPAVLTIAGSDSSGGAGIEADLKTFSAHNVYGLTCIAALTAQNTQLVKTFEKTPKALISNILDLNFKDFVHGYEENQQPLKAIKTGMLTSEAVEVLGEYLPEIKKHNIKLVLDPVMISTSGSKLIDEEGMKLCVDTLIKDAYLVTPNFDEARALSGIAIGVDFPDAVIETKDDYLQFVKSLSNALKCQNILVKGGHLPWDLRTDAPFKGTDYVGFEDHIGIVDVLYQPSTDEATFFVSKFINSKDTHGTGCTLASAIAANVAKGVPLKEAIALSIDFIHQGILSMGRKLGFGHGPLNHNIKPEVSFNLVVTSSSSKVQQEIISNKQSFLEYFKNHSKVKDNWREYTEHRFVKLLAEDKLEFDRFLYFLKQDYYYLVNYAQMHGLAASSAPTYHQTHAESLIIGNIVNEIERHKEKLCKKYDIDYERDIDLDIELQPGKACLDYCNYLLDIGNKEDFLGIKVALAPCLHGYYEAGTYGVEIRKNFDVSTSKLDKETSEVYESWLGDYNSEWYASAYEEGKQTLQELMEKQEISDDRLEELVGIFNEVTKLEVRFWDEVLK
ncbi:Phosphomethylpyrimidine kinase [Scheffersomyces xylosifermentans]|uniref:Phosphomethylpyrimidine kinase n=1 Tax=Scheffersomyces xylosifermentans TaxID=1304137 RepID=UPI00315E001A